MCAPEMRNASAGSWACWEPDPRLAEFSCSLPIDLSGLYWTLERHPPLSERSKGNPINKYCFPLLLPFSCTTHNTGSVDSLKTGGRAGDGSSGQCCNSELRCGSCKLNSSVLLLQCVALYIDRWLFKICFFLFLWRGVTRWVLSPPRFCFNLQLSRGSK